MIKIRYTEFIGNSNNALRMQHYNDECTLSGSHKNKNDGIAVINVFSIPLINEDDISAYMCTLYRYTWEAPFAAYNIFTELKNKKANKANTNKRSMYLYSPKYNDTNSVQFFGFQTISQKKENKYDKGRWRTIGVL